MSLPAPASPPALYEGGAMRIERGGYALFQFAMRADHFADALPDSPQAIAQSGGTHIAQRGFMEPHARKITRYIAMNPTTWGFGPISIAMPESHIEWEPASENGYHQFGTLLIPTGNKAAIKILDGQHRRSAISMLLGDKKLGGISTKQRNAGRDSLRRSAISIDLYVVNTERKAAQLFSDMAQARNVAAAERVVVDSRDPFHRAIRRWTRGQKTHADIAWLIELIAPVITPEGTPGPRSITVSTPYWFATNAIARIIKYRALRAGRLYAKDRTAWTQENIDKLAGTLFNKELPQLRPEWEAARTMSGRAIAEARAQSWLYVAAMSQTAAQTLYESEANGRDLAPLIDYWQNAEFDRDKTTGQEPYLRIRSDGRTQVNPHAGKTISEYLTERLPA